MALNKYGISMETVRTVITSTNANKPKGMMESGERVWTIYANDQAKKAVEYQSLIIAWRKGSPVRLADVAEVTDSVQDIRN
ncbi:efflux RND transporter permease subunit, partial [Stenotrophomonas maltophilia]|uniref:efflux RND transporter permease subunit n=3 Tax=Pseudomonadota TaxID=1224 RepID=UPI001EF7E46D